MEDTKEIKAHIREHYRAIYGREECCRLPVLQGRPLAKALDYPVSSLDFIPDELWQSFLPCGNPVKSIGQPARGELILNLGSGTGIDSFALLALHGGLIRVVSLDVVFEPVRKASAFSDELSRSGLFGMESRSPILHWVCGDGEKLPFQTGAFDRVIMNGVFNLFPDKAAILREVERILRHGGMVAIADLCCNGPLPDYFQNVLDAWVWCMSGACTEAQLEACLADAGFIDICLDSDEEDKEGGEQFYRIAAAGCKAGSAL